MTTAQSAFGERRAKGLVASDSLEVLLGHHCERKGFASIAKLHQRSVGVSDMDHTDTLKPPAFSHPKAEHPSIPRGISLMI
jgi:hypothetical protein